MLDSDAPIEYTVYTDWEGRWRAMPVTVIGSRAARAKWRMLLDAAHSGAADVVIERSGKPVAALIPYADYAALLDELDDLRAGRRAETALAEWRRDPSRGTPLEQVEAEMRAAGLLDGGE